MFCSVKKLLQFKSGIISCILSCIILYQDFLYIFKLLYLHVIVYEDYYDVLNGLPSINKVYYYYFYYYYYL